MILQNIIMIRRAAFIFSLFIFLLLQAKSQETRYLPGYQTVIINNPAYSGSEGDGLLRLSYLNFYPGRNFGLNSFFVSYDSFFPALHGGAGFYLSNDHVGGIVNDLRGGISYSYHLQADKNVYINGGLSGSFICRGYGRGDIILPDQIDPVLGPVLPAGESTERRGRAVFDVGAGFLFISGRYTAGLSVSHLARPDLDGDDFDGGKLDRKYSVQLSSLYRLGVKSSFQARPVLFAEFQGSGWLAGAGGVLESDFFSVSAVMLAGRAGDLDLQTGLSLNAGRVFVFYNYCFNLSSGNSLLPASLVQHAGVGIRLNNVDKRKIIKTINYPKL